MTHDAPTSADEAAAKLSSICLRDFSAPYDADAGEVMKFSVARDEWPVPYLIRYALLLIGLEDMGRWDKTAFRIPFRYRGRAAAITYEKFGMRFYLQHASQDEADRTAAVKAHREIVDNCNPLYGLSNRGYSSP
ncbi:hypothetical protein M8J71_10970 [Pseudarthrobacter sp. R1]|uniref:hypothetical protein n=1 Tax=Pseudarthrobacter sp. R1 TaxID=2944934 RepID=UPI0021099845|nr:hypothetical protein [Pseudarthrobacter sp. R1]MCQ6271005.1 hypothetical protein [Pseudarthrobacter sp. R1]